MKAPKTEKVKIESLILNDSNPRIIKDDKFKKLVNSIKNFPEMLPLRPIVVDESNIILGGNMRYRAMQEAGLQEVYIIKAEALTEQQKKEFIIKDNIGYGEWDWDILANEWNIAELKEWALDIPEWYNADDVDIEKYESGKKEEVNSTAITLNFTQEQYEFFNEHIYKFGSNKEDSILSLIEKSI